MLVVLALVSCTDQYMVEDVTGDTAAQTPVSEIDILKERYRQAVEYIHVDIGRGLWGHQ